MEEQIIKFHGKFLRTGLFRNEHNVMFQENYIINEESKHISKSYICNSCGKLLLSKTGAENHNCQAHLTQIAEEIMINRHRSAMEYILRFIATSNIAYRAIENENLEAALVFLDPTFQLPRRSKLRDEMISLSAQITQHTISELFGQTASLLFDSCKRWGQNYQGIIIYTTKRLYIWSTIPTDDSTALSLADVIASTVIELTMKGVKIVSVCTDNSSANKAALDGDDDSAQEIAGEHFVREPCSAHTSNLALEDTFSIDEEFGFVSNHIKFLIDHAPKNTYRKGFKPRYINIRWLSLYECTCFIVDHMESFRKSRLENVQEVLDEVEKKIGWNNLVIILSIMKKFVDSIQKDLASIADLPPHYFIARSELINLPVPAAHRLAAYLEFRFTETCPLQLPLFAYLMTPDGLRLFQQDNREQQEAMLNAATSGMEGYMRERGFDENTISGNKISFYYYLINFDAGQFGENANPVDFWNQYINKISIFDVISHSFISIVTEVLQIPSSESAVERLFASLSKMVSCENCNVSPETLNARLCVKFDSIFSRASSITLAEISENPEKVLKLKKF